MSAVLWLQKHILKMICVLKYILKVKRVFHHKNVMTLWMSSTSLGELTLQDVECFINVFLIIKDICCPLREEPRQNIQYDI